MLQDSRHKRVTFKITTYLFEVLLHFIVRTIGSESCHRRQRELFTGIIIYHFIKTDYRLFPRFYDTDYVLCRYFVRIQAVKLLNLVVSPGPFIRIIILMHFRKAGVDGL